MVYFESQQIGYSYRYVSQNPPLESYETTNSYPVNVEGSRFRFEGVWGPQTGYGGPGAGSHTFSAFLTLKDSNGAALASCSISGTFSASDAEGGLSVSRTDLSVETTGLVGWITQPGSLSPVGTMTTPPLWGGAWASGETVFFYSDVLALSPGHDLPENCTLEVIQTGTSSVGLHNFDAAIASSQDPYVNFQGIANESVVDFSATAFWEDFFIAPSTTRVITDFNWTLGTGTEPNGATITGQPITVNRNNLNRVVSCSQEIEHDFIEGGTWPVTLIVVDNEYGWAKSTGTVTTTGSPEIDIKFDQAGIAWGVNNSGTSVVLRKLLFGLFLPTTIYTFTNARDASLMRHNGRLRWFVMLCNRSTQKWNLFYSDDAGKSFSLAMPIEIWDSTFRAAQICATQSGAVSVALKKNTNPVQVWFRRSPDGLEWPDEDEWAPQQIATLQGNGPVRIEQNNAVGRNEIVVTDLFGKYLRSSDMGRNWDEL